MATTNPFTVDGNTYALWSMNGTVGSAGKQQDDTGTSAHALVENGTLTAGTGQTTPTANGTYGGFGANKNLQVTNVNLVSWPSGAQTWELWVNPSSYQAGTGLEFIFSKQNSPAGSYLSLDATGHIQGRVSDGVTTLDFVGTAAISLSAWSYIAIVFVPSTSLTIYINGSQDKQITVGVPTSALATTNDLYIGTQSNVAGDGTFSWLGDIDSMKISTVALSSGTISTYYNFPAPSTAHNLALMGAGT